MHTVLSTDHCRDIVPRLFVLTHQGVVPPSNPAVAAAPLEYHSSDGLVAVPFRIRALQLAVRPDSDEFGRVFRTVVTGLMFFKWVCGSMKALWISAR